MGGSRNPKCGKTYYVGRSLYMTASYLTPLVLTLNLMPLVSRTLERADPLAGMVAVGVSCRVWVGLTGLQGNYSVCSRRERVGKGWK